MLLKVLVPLGFIRGFQLVEAEACLFVLRLFAQHACNLIVHDRGQPPAKTSTRVIVLESADGFGHTKQDFLSDIRRIIRLEASLTTVPVDHRAVRFAERIPRITIVVIANSHQEAR